MWVGTIDINGKSIDAANSPETAVNDALVVTQEQVAESAGKLRGGDIDIVLLIDSSGLRNSLRVIAKEVMPQLDQQATMPVAA